jgi:hypothetical protein
MRIIKEQFVNIFGENPTPFDMVLINVAGPLSGIIIAWGIPEISQNLSLLKKIILVIIAWDINGGIIATLTRSTSRYIYFSNRYARLWFYALHVIQPLVIFIVAPASFEFFLFSWVFTVGSAVVVSEFIPEERRHSVAGFLLMMGFIYYTYFIEVPLAWRWFGYAFMAKVLLGHAVDHYGFNKEDAPDEE